MDEVRQVREQYAALFDYNLYALYLDIKTQEQQSDRSFIAYPARRIPPTQLAS